MSRSSRDEDWGERTAEAPNLSLRERAKREAMLQVQAVALDLFDARGYGAVTVEEVARAAGTSASTVYRYFGTKDRLILHDEYDQVLAETFLAGIDEGLTLVDAGRQAMAAIARTLREDPTAQRRARYMSEQPGIWAQWMLETRAAIKAVTAQIARRRGVEVSTDLTIKVNALAGVLLLTLEEWWNDGADVPALVEQALDVLEAGIRD